MKKCGIYTIINIINKKIYVGYSHKLLPRLNSHKHLLRNNIHSNIYLQNEFNKYGEENFSFEILEECSRELLPAIEHYWATILNSHNKEYGYNLAPTHPENHRIMTDEINMKISISKMGQPSPRKGVIVSEETKNKMSLSKKGKISNNKGKKLTQEKRLKLKGSRTGIPNYKKRIKDILKLDYNGTIICKYKDIYECMEKEHLKFSRVYNHLLGPNKKLRGKKFILKFEKLC